MQRMGANNTLIQTFIVKSLCAIVILSVMSCGQNSERKQEAPDIDIVSVTVPATEFQQKMQTTKGFVLLDVRSPEEYAQGFIEGSTNVNFNNEDFQARIEALDKEATYFVYCAGGGRSSKAVNLMKDLKFKSVYELEGGYNGWKANGLPVKTE